MTMQAYSSKRGSSTSGTGKSARVSSQFFDDPLIENITFPAPGLIMLHFRDGRAVQLPTRTFPSLAYATDEALRNWEIIGEGVGVHWADLDEDLPASAFWGGGYLVRNNPGSLERFYYLEKRRELRQPKILRAWKSLLRDLKDLFLQ